MDSQEVGVLLPVDGPRKGNAKHALGLTGDVVRVEVRQASRHEGDEHPVVWLAQGRVRESPLHAFFVRVAGDQVDGAHREPHVLRPALPDVQHAPRGVEPELHVVDAKQTPTDFEVDHQVEGVVVGDVRDRCPEAEARGNRDHEIQVVVLLGPVKV